MDIEKRVDLSVIVDQEKINKDIARHKKNTAASCLKARKKRKSKKKPRY